MGSHQWRAITDYDPDVGVALARAQAEVFARGEYGFTYKMKSACAAMGLPVPALPEEPRAHSIEEARQIAAESGTCSVLDVYDVGAEPAPAVTGPFSSDVLREIVKTETPTLGQVEACLSALYERLDRGASAHIVCHEHGKPKQYLFIGMSFD